MTRSIPLVDGTDSESQRREVAPQDLSVRRMRLLRDLARDVGIASSLDLYLSAAAKSLAHASLDLPLLLFYSLDPECRRARLVAHVGQPTGPTSIASELTIDSDGATGWPLKAALAAGRPFPIHDFAARFPGLAARADLRPLECAYVLPIHAREAQASALAIAGASPGLPMDEAYVAFLELLAATLTRGVAATIAVDAASRHCDALEELEKNAAEKLAEANQELEAFSYSVSHDLRAPLRAIDGFSKALGSDYGERLDDEGRRYIDRIRAGTHRMAQLIDDLLSLSRITRQQLTAVTVDVTAIAQKVLVDLSTRDPQRKVEWNVSDGLVGWGAPHLVTVLFENLLGNAWKFSSKRPDARIEVGAQVSSDCETTFFVRDNGAGFDIQYAGKLFVPFQRLHAAREFPGTGIGLATVHRVVTRHGGRIWAESAPQKGATFFFTLGEHPR